MPTTIPENNVWLRKWRELANIDLRSLALFRIGLGITIFVDLYSFLPDFTMQMTDDGVFPRPLALMGRSWEAFSIFMISGRYEMLLLLFLITALAAFALIFGYYTRVACFICWFMVASLNVRATVFLSSADVQLAVLLFWAMFLPLGARFSIDHALAAHKTASPHYAAIAGLAVLLQESYLYFMGALLKTGDSWQISHRSVEAALSNIHLKTMFSDYLLQFPELMQWLTVYVYHLELYAAVFLFFPFFTAQLRMLMFVLLAAMHLGFCIFLDISFFPLISIVGLTIFIPGFFWERLAKELEGRVHSARHVMYYDEACGFCKKTCLIFKELSVLFHTPVETAQSVPKIYDVMQKENSWVVKTPSGALLVRWDAVAYVWRRSPLLWPLGMLFKLSFLQPLGDTLYTLIAHNRKQLGIWSARFLPQKDHIGTQSSTLTVIFLAPLMLLVFLWNLHNQQEYKNIPVPRVVVSILSYTKLWQDWSMFAPYPSASSMWVEVEGKLAGGESVDLLHETDAPPSHLTPSVGDEALPTRRWHKFYEFFHWDNMSKPAFTRAYCMHWAKENPWRRLDRVVVTYYHQRNLIGTPRETWPIVKNVMLDYPCVPPKNPAPGTISVPPPAAANSESPQPQTLPKTAP